VEPPYIFRYVNRKFPNKFWIPSNPASLQHLHLNTNSWFRMTTFLNPNFSKNNDFSNLGDPDFSPTKKDVYKTYKIKIFPTEEQKIIFSKWFNSYRIMYNETNKIIKNLYHHEGIYYTNFITLRNKYMKDVKQQICKHSGLLIHIADLAIKDICAKYKSSIENKHKNFRIRYKKINAQNKYFFVESRMINKNKTSFCPSQLGNTIVTEHNFSLKNIKSDFMVQYISKLDTYYLVIPELVTKTESKNKSAISLDPGCETFMTGYTDEFCIKIGYNVGKIIKPILFKMDGIKRTVKDEKLKKKLLEKCEIKIENLIDDLHWKVIDFLTENYGTIYLGNLSTKSIVSNKNKLPKIVKRIMLKLSLCKFKERLKYKCEAKGIEYYVVDERYTSITCGLCYDINRNLGKGRMYNCTHYKPYVMNNNYECIYNDNPFIYFKIDRDMNGARNIMLRGIYEHKIRNK
jgi:IS605 OrfB family transposase